MASEKGFINPNTAILCDEPAKPYIRSEGGITDVVSDHITDIIADQAHEIFDTDEVKEAIDGTAVLIQTIIPDDETLSYIINNIDYRQTFIKIKANEPGQNLPSCVVKYNDNIIDTIYPFSSVKNQISVIGFFRQGDMIIPFYNLPSTYASILYIRPSASYLSRLRSINKIELNLSGNMPSGTNYTIEVWGVK